jgi:ribose transport system permease protein
MTPRGAHLYGLALQHATLLLFAIVLLVFGVLSPVFFTPQNLLNILVQSSSTAIVAVGMTFVLLTAGVDLSVGAIMFVAAAIAGKLVLGGMPLSVAMAAILATGLALGALNAAMITGLRMMPFIVTLGVLYFGRGLALWITQTRAMNLPPSFLEIGTGKVLGVPLPIMIFGSVVAVAHLVLTRTPFGRQVYAVGFDQERARKAGVNTRATLASVYLICGFCAAVGGILSLAQLGAVSPTFGTNKEFAAIAAAVLGGTSLFGGRGNVFPGVVVGTVLIQSIENGLVVLNADPYLYPLITSGIIFLAVLTDSLRTGFLSQLNRRKIRVEEAL